jgi:hypothetical protein
MSESGSDHFSDLEEEASEVSSQAKREVSPGERGLSSTSVPEVIQGAELEKLLLEENFLRNFEREYLHLPLNEALPELQSAQIPTRKRGQPVKESTNLQRAVRSRTSTRSPSPQRFNSPPRGQPKLQPAEEPFNLLSKSERVDDILRETEEFVRNAFLFLQDDVYPATNKVGRALSRFKDKFCKRCAHFRIFHQGDLNVFVQIDLRNPGQPPRAVIWGEERFKVVQALHKGEGHYGGSEKTRLKVAD